MKELIPVIFFLVVNTLNGWAQKSPLLIESVPNQKVWVKGSLAQGNPMPDLSWAWNSANACFVSTKQQKFSGHHVLYQTMLPPRAEMIIRLQPKDPAHNLSLYAYSTSMTDPQVVPDLHHCVSCEASFKSDYQSSESDRKVELRAITNPYQVIIGVAGAEGLKSSDYQLEIELIGGAMEEKGLQERIPVYQAETKKGEILAYKGNLAEGKIMQDLSWAWNSSNACFVAPSKDKFSGHHILFVTEIHSYSELTITLIPDDPDQDMSLYAYMLGKSGRLRLVPDLPSCVTCEADFSSTYQKEKEAEKQVSLRALRNPYQVIIGICGAEALKEGTFILKLAEE